MTLTNEWYEQYAKRLTASAGKAGNNASQAAIREFVRLFEIVRAVRLVGEGDMLRLAVEVGGNHRAVPIPEWATDPAKHRGITRIVVSSLTCEMTQGAVWSPTAIQIGGILVLTLPAVDTGIAEAVLLWMVMGTPGNEIPDIFGTDMQGRAWLPRWPLEGEMGEQVIAMVYGKWNGANAGRGKEEAQ